MKKGTYGLPNIMPNGVLEPIEQMDMVMAKIEHDGKRAYEGVDQKLSKRSKVEE
ncbi:MAG: hypothetical protein ACOZCL_07285 [Bacillota bacterium]